MFLSNPQLVWRLILATLIALIISGINVALLRAATVEVEVLSGRTFKGEVDHRSDGERLWLRSEYSGATVIRPMDWGRVVSTTVEGQNISVADFRREIDRYKESTSAELPAPKAPPSPIEILPPESAPTFPENGSRTGKDNRDKEVIAIPRFPQPRPQVRSLRIDAYLANFNNTAEADGLILHVYPLDARGRIVPVDGTLDVELWGTARNDQQTTNEFPNLGRWVEMVRPNEMDFDGAVFQLPFQAAHPEFNLELGPKAIVYAKLAIPGQGVFEAHTGAIRVREYNPIRDRLQQREGTRFFPSERTSRGER